MLTESERATLLAAAKLAHDLMDRYGVVASEIKWAIAELLTVVDRESANADE